MIPLYRIDKLSFAYQKSPVLEIDRLEIEFGRVTAVIGPNGSGKSTLLKLLAFLLFPERGQIQFMGSNAENARILLLRRRIGLVLQNPYFLRGSVVDNIQLGLELRGIRKNLRRERSVSALARVGMEGFQHCNVRELSGGEAQKIALARTLALDPDVLLFDEPFTYLDQSSQAMIERLIVDYGAQSKKTVVFTTHDKLHGLAIADKNISLMGGRSVPGSLVNLFPGHVDRGNFWTGKIAVLLPRNVAGGDHLAVDPSEIVISLKPLESSMRNTFRGRVVAIAEDRGQVRVTVDAKENFNVLITQESLEKLALSLGETVWLGFKSTAVEVF